MTSVDRDHLLTSRSDSEVMLVNERCCSFLKEAEKSHRPRRSPPGLASLRNPLTSKDNITDWLRLILDADHTQGNGPTDDI